MANEQKREQGAGELRRLVSLGDTYADVCTVCGERGEYGVAPYGGPKGCMEALRTARVYCKDHIPTDLITRTPDSERIDELADRIVASDMVIDALEGEVVRLRAYAQRDLDCEYKECPVKDCIDCQYYNTLKGAREALASTQEHE